MVVKLSTFLSTSLADGLDSALVTGIIANTDVALDSGTTGNYIATITGGDGITVVNGAAHEADAIVRVDSATVATDNNTLTVTNKTFNLTNNTLTGTLGQFNAALNGSTFASLDGGETLTNKTLTSPTINTPQIIGPGSFSKITTLGLRDQTTNAYDLRVQSNSSTNLTDNRTLTVDVENVNRTVKLGGDIIIDKELRTAGDFNLLMNLTDSTNITLPTSGTVMQFDSNGASTITGAFTAGTLTGVYQGADSDITVKVTKAFVDNLGVDASTLGGRDSDYFLNYNNFTNTPAGSVALASLGVNPPGSASNGQLWWDDSAGNLYIYYVDSDGDTQWIEAVPQLAAEDFVSTSGGTVAGNLIISNNGKIGIGTSTPEATLHVEDVGTTGPAVHIAGGSGTEGDITVPHDENLQIGHWNETTDTYTDRLSMNDSGIFTFDQRVHIEGTNVDDGYGVGYYTYGLDVGGMTTISGPNSYDALTVENTSTDFAGVRIRMRDGNSTANQYSHWYMNSDVVYFNSNNSNVAWQSTADGVLSTPNQPGFSVRSAALSAIDASSSYTLFTSLYSTNFNEGSHFSSSNGRFTAPVEGKYVFGTAVRYDQFGGSYFYTSIFVNGSSLVGRVLSSLTGTYLDQSVTACVSLSQNDYVEVKITAAGDTSINIDPDTFFWGYKIG